MPGFLIFEEFGIDPDMPFAGVAKTGLAMLPGSWMLHGLGGEFNVDIDPVAELRETLDGGGALGSVASGDVLAFWEAYKGWISVVSVAHDIPGAARDDRRHLEQQTDEALNSLGDDGGLEVTADMIFHASQDQAAGQKVDTAALENIGKRKKQAISSMNSGAGVGELTVEVEIDVSLPKIIEGALKQPGGKTFDVADIHMCTTAQVDVSQLTLGDDNPATSLIQTLVGAYLFNIVPYLSISMRDVKIENVSFNVMGDAGQSPPTASLTLSFKKVKWTYHVINGSNMNLYNVSYEYDLEKRDQPPAGLSFGSLLNPFG